MAPGDGLTGPAQQAPAGDVPWDGWWTHGRMQAVWKGRPKRYGAGSWVSHQKPSGPGDTLELRLEVPRIGWEEAGGPELEETAQAKARGAGK